MSVEQFAHELGIMPSVLLEQLQAAGVKKTFAEDSLTEQDKAQLLDYLRKTHGAKQTKEKITLTRRQTSEIRKSDSMGRARTIQVVRKRRILTKSPFENEVSEQSTEAESTEKSRKFEPVVDAEELALREAEARKQAELIARQVAEIQRKKLKKVETEKIEKSKSTVSAEEVEIQKEITGVDTAIIPSAVAGQTDDRQINAIAQKEGDKALTQEAAAAKQQERVNTENEQEAESKSKGLQAVDANKTVVKPVKKVEKPEKLDKTDKADKKKKPVKQLAWSDEGARKRAAAKVREDLSSGQGWRGRRDKQQKFAEIEKKEHGFSAP
ncbi:MAG TPA: translation initiation factor IF-2 N-terminal domain-containing protein, partial [Nitrosomonas sp.]|nr:translation initiation factor IF-2 N-terminal domain-containing protein [Nitrosomonas sp.]